MPQFADQLILAPWALQQLGISEFEQLSTLLRAPEFEGWADDGGTLFVPQLVARLPKGGTRTVSDEMLRDYDNHIVAHWKHITQKRNLRQPHTLYLTYFQYLALLFTELYLDRYFQDRAALLESLNEFLKTKTTPAPTLAKGKAKRQTAPVIEPYTAADLNKIAYWMATGSGKTLLMHCHIRQYLHYAGQANRRDELNRIILLTPNEGLSRQHKEEFELSGIEADFYDKDALPMFSGRGVDIIDIHKLRETSGEKTVAVSTFEGKNLVLVDEGHRGAGGEEWMDKRAQLCADGFSFEYSATFGQSIKAASSAKQKDLTQTYAKCILFDYSYKFFYEDGYGKDFNILNLAQEKEAETRPLYLTACLLAFYQQCRRFADGGASLVPYLLESPLLVFVGGSVTGQREAQQDTDLVLILKFLAEFIGKRAETERRLEKLLARQDGLVAGGQRVFDQMFPYVEMQWKPAEASALYSDIMRQVFNAPGGGQLHIVRLQGSEGEIGLRVGENEWFGVVNVGDAKKLWDLTAERKGAEDSYVTQELAFSDSLFEALKRENSSIRILAGAKKFTEGWSSWRVSAMGLMNVGKKEGSEIIQLFGRGVRLKGYKYKLKRTAALDVMDLQSDGVPQKHPDHIELLETLNIFGIKSDYMKEFEEYLEEEGVGKDERREIIFLPTLRLPEFENGKLQLHIIRKQQGITEFKDAVRLKLESLEGALNNRVSADWYPRLQKQSSLAGGGASATLNQEPLRGEHLAFLNWNTLWYEVERHKRDKAYYNILLTPDGLRALLEHPWWYELYIPPGYLDFRFGGLPLWQEIAASLLKSYLERFYQYKKAEYEKPFLEYQVLLPNDELILKQYQLLVKKSERTLLKRLQELAKKFALGQFEAFQFANLDLFQAPHHLYQPLIHLAHHGEEALVKVVPTHLNEGEKKFVDDLEAYCKANATTSLATTELYLLRNHSSENAISFFTGSGFRPDFIMWLLRGGQQTIAFLDPKGMRNFTDTFNNPKVKLARELKDLEQKMNEKFKRADIRLESFLISQTSRSDLRWASSADAKQQAKLAEYKQHHILMAKDEPDAYVGDLMQMLLSNL